MTKPAITPRALALAVALCLALTTAALAQRPSYFSPSAVDPVKLLPGFPSPESAEAHDELKLMLMIQRDRTRKDVARCASEVTLSLDAFQNVLGPWCTSENLPQLSKLFRQAAKDARPLVGAAKDHFKRPRPAAEDARIDVPIKKDMSYSYPSGHSTLATMYALILARLAPAERDAILDRGRQIGWDRVVAGEHHPSDIYAGRALGQALAESLLASPKFEQELPALEAEFSNAQRHAARTAEPIGAGH
jgi:acid phosphatase (class A)